MEYVNGQLDRDSFSVGTFEDDDARCSWRTRAPDERLAALEFLRQVMYDYDPAADRLQKVFEVAELGRR